MKDYQAENIRNIAVIGHGSEGKTTLLEAMLFATGAVDRQGRIEDGGTVSDFDAEEMRRHISISASVVPVEFAKRKINFVDVPGYFDFIGEMMGPMRAVESALIVVGAPSGVVVGTEKAWAQAQKNGLAKFIAINQMDREHVDFHKVLASLREEFGSIVIPLILPIGQGPSMKGVVDIIAMKAFEGAGKTMKEIPIPADMQAAVEEAREIVKEAAAGTSEELMEKYFEAGELSDEEMLTGLSAGVLEGTLVPVAPVSSLNGIGVSPLLFALSQYMPSPAGRISKGLDPKDGKVVERVCAIGQPFSAQVFKTLADPFVGKLSLIKVLSGTLASGIQIYNANQDKPEKASNVSVMRGKKQTSVDNLYAGDIGALAKLQFTSTGDTLCETGKPVKYPEIAFPKPSVSMAVFAKKAGEEDKVFGGLARLQEEDPSITLDKNVETYETLINGQGELHLEVIRQKLFSKFSAEAVFKDPRIPYRESIRKTIQAEGRHKKQSGGHGQFGHVKIEFSPIPGSTEFEFVDAVVGGVVPRNFIPSVEKGLRENLPKGVLAGYPMVGIRAKLYDGSYHAVDSSEMAFKTAARIAYKKCIDASPVLLEPINHIEVLVPDENMGDIIGDITKRRGRILGMNQVDGMQQVVAEVPLAELFKYATDLRSMTQARGSFTMTYERYEEVPSMVAQKIIDAHKTVEDEDEDE